MEEGKRNRTPVSALNKVEPKDPALPIDGSNLPVAMVEDRISKRTDGTSQYSANFGTDRPVQGGGAYVGDGVGAHTIAANFPIGYRNSFTLNFWCKANSLSQTSSAAFVSSSNSGTTADSFQVDTGEGTQLRFQLEGQNNLLFLGTLDTEYHMLTIVADGNTVKIYTDSIFKGSRQVALSLYFDAFKLLTNRSTNAFIDGVIFNVAIFDRVFTEEEIDAIYNANTYVDNSNLFLHYKCQEKSGDIAYDSSGNGNNGDIVNLYEGFHGTQNAYSFADEEGYLLSDGITYYADQAATQLIPEGVIIPIKNNGSSIYETVAYLANGQPAFTTVIGKVPSRAKFVEGNVFYTDTTGRLNGQGFQPTLHYEVLFKMQLENYQSNQDWYLLFGEDSTTTNFFLRHNGQFLYVNIGNVAYELETLMDVGYLEMRSYHVKVFGTTLEYYINDNLYKTIVLTTTPTLTGDKIQVSEFLGTPSANAFTIFDIIYNELDGTGSFVSQKGYWPLSEEIKTPDNHTYHDVSDTAGVPNGNHAQLVNGSLANNGTADKVDGEYSQLGYNIDGVTGQQIPALASDITKDALGNPITNPQDGYSFLEGCKLQHEPLPRVVQADTNNFLFDANGDPINKEVADFTGNEADQIFSDVSEADKVSNIRTHTKALTGRQLNTEKIITKN